MTDQLCAKKNCNRPPIQGSKYCEYHLAENTRKTRDTLGIGSIVLAFIGLALKIVLGIKKS